MKNSQEVATIIKKAAKAAKIPVGELLTNCGLSKNALSSMQSGGYFPRTENLVNIAEHLNCSVDYLLGRTDNPQAHKSGNNVSVGNVSGNNGIVGNVVDSTINEALMQNDQETALLNVFRKLDVVGKARLLSFGADALEKNSLHMEDKKDD